MGPDLVREVVREKGKKETERRRRRRGGGDEGEGGDRGEGGEVGEGGKEGRINDKTQDIKERKKREVNENEGRITK